MKKGIIVCITAAFLLFSGASPWEGAAAAAPEGELPANGRYVATNSFPRNTEVDITNIETNKSTRAIVAGSLDSPGLLAVVSREAAELIGMRPGSISRIRMTQPSDPIAYLRFTEGLSSGIPDYDSGNVITKENYREEREEIAARPSLPSANPDSRASRQPSSEVPASSAPPYYLEPEWGGSQRNIIDLPGYTAPGETPYIASNGYDAPDETAEIYKEEEYFPETAEAYEEEEYYPEIAEAYGEEEYYPEITEAYEEKEEIVELIEEPAQKAVEFVLVPTQKKPPENDIYGIDPASIIPGISRAPAEPKPAVKTAPVEKDAVYTAPIEKLDRGWYYVQIAVADSVESAESAVSNIDRNYKPFVYKDGERRYCVLLRPMNQGESAAALQRFKSIGYKDAFVRRGG
jgi:hypothetical protein